MRRFSFSVRRAGSGIGARQQKDHAEENKQSTQEKWEKMLKISSRFSFFHNIKAEAKRIFVIFSLVLSWIPTRAELKTRNCWVRRFYFFFLLLLSTKRKKERNCALATRGERSRARGWKAIPWAKASRVFRFGATCCAPKGKSEIYLARKVLGATGADENEFRIREIIAMGRKISWRKIKLCSWKPKQKSNG